MRKLLLLLISVYFCANSAFAQCTPAAVSNPGIYPDSATNFLPAYQGSPYEQLITVKVPLDTVAAGIPIQIAYIELNSITGLPQGLNYSCLPSNCKFPGGETNCAVINGTTNDPVGEYPLTIKVTPWVILAPGTPPIAYSQQTLTYYKIIVNPANAIQSLNGNTFSVIQNIPNPSDHSCEIFYSLTSKSDVEIKLVNAIGKEIQKIKTNGNAGVNKYELNTQNLPQGIYFYSLYNGKEVITKKLIVSH